MNMVSSDAMHNTKILVNNLRDETARHFQKQALDMSAMTPEANTNVLQAKVLTVETTLTAEHLRLRTELSTYNDELQAKLLSVDVAQQNRQAALQIIAADTATELKSVRDLTMNLNSLTNHSNANVAPKFQEMDAALEKLKSHAKPQDQANQEPANPRRLNQTQGLRSSTQSQESVSGLAIKLRRRRNMDHRTANSAEMTA